MTVDEAHYVLYGQKLALSYFDHPPMVGWVQWLFQLLPLHENLQARLPAILISLLTSWLTFQFLIKKNTPAMVASAAVIALNLTPLFNSLSVALLPDTLLMPLTILVLMQTEAVLKKSDVLNWTLLGLYLGLAGLSKYTAFLYPLALVILFVQKRRWNELLRPPLWLGVLIAGIIVSPVLIWNIQNDFASFKYQTDHVSSEGRDYLKIFFSSMGVQLLSWGVFPFLLTLFWHFRQLQLSLKNKNIRVELIFLTVFLAFFFWIAKNEVLLPHWMLMYFALAVPLAICDLTETLLQRRLVTISYAFSGLLSLTLLTETAFKVLPAKASSGLYYDIYGWPELMNKAQQLYEQLPAQQKAIAVMNWSLGSRALYYNYNRAPIFVLDRREDQFDIWNTASPLGRDYIVMIEASKVEENLNKLNCRSLQQVGEKITNLKGVPVQHFLYYHCAHLDEVKN